MLNAGILPGDLVVVHQQPTAHNGEIVVALLEDEATVKRLSPQKWRGLAFAGKMKRTALLTDAMLPFWARWPPLCAPIPEKVKSRCV